MKAAVLREVGKPLEIEEIEISKPGPREVLVRTVAAGVCHSDLHFIEGWESDPHYMSLTEFAQNNTTHYDFYWYAIWEDGEGEQQFIERKWLNRELNP